MRSLGPGLSSVLPAGERVTDRQVRTRQAGAGRQPAIALVDIAIYDGQERAERGSAEDVCRRATSHVAGTRLLVARLTTASVVGHRWRDIAGAGARERCRSGLDGDKRGPRGNRSTDRSLNRHDGVPVLEPIQFALCQAIFQIRLRAALSYPPEV